MSTVPRAYEEAAQRWGYLADGEAKKYGVANGATLLLKIAKEESGFSSDLGITSYAGARGPAQFMPATRAAYMKQYGVDPWASVDQALHAMALFLKTTGLAGYNPGSSSYISEVLHQPVHTTAGAGPKAAKASPDAAAIDAASSKWHVPTWILWGIFGAESSFGKAENKFGLLAAAEGTDVSNTPAAAMQAAKTLQGLKRQYGSWAQAIVHYSGGDYTIAHVKQLAQEHGVPRGGGATAAAAPSREVSSSGGGPDLMRFLVTAALVLGGLALAGVGITRSVGAAGQEAAA